MVQRAGVRRSFVVRALVALTLFLGLGATGTSSAAAAPGPAGTRTGRAPPPSAEGTAAAAPIGPVTSYGIALRRPHGIARDAEGHPWVTNADGFWLSRVDNAGAPVQTVTGEGIDRPWGITLGPDGRLWFTNRGSDSIGALTTAGVVANFTAAGIDDPQGIAAGPDGNLWFTNGGGNSIGRITTAGSITVFGHSSIDHPTAITAGPGGALWFTNAGHEATPSSIGRITTDGVVTAYVDPSISGPAGIAAGPDGNVWFTNSTASSIGRITPAGVVTAFPGAASPQGIIAGPDGDLWFTQDTSSVGSITTAGAITQHEDYGSYLSGGARDGSGLVLGSSPIPALLYPQPGGDTVGAPCLCSLDEYLVYSERRTGFIAPADIATDAAGTLWHTDFGDRFPNMGHPYEPGNSSIGRITRSGVASGFSVGSAGPLELTRGAGGNMWYLMRLSSLGGFVGAVSPAGAFTSVGPLGAGVRPAGLTAGPDGNTWIAAGSAGVVRIEPFAKVTTFPQSAVTEPDVIATGPDGAVWYANSFTGAVGRITTSGIASPFIGPGSPRPAGARATQLAAGLDGRMWFTDGTAIGSITTDGVITTYEDPAFDHPLDLVLGPDGNIWFANAGNLTAPAAGRGSLGRITPTGVVSTFGAKEISNPTRIVAGADGDVWFLNATSNTIGRVTVTETPGAPRDVTAAAGDQAATVSWVAPESQGPSPISGYTVTASPGGSTCTWLGGPLSCSVTGLTNGASYTFSVTATNAAGAGPPAAAAPLTIGAGLFFHPLAPVRLLDSRGAVGGWNAPLGATPRPLAVAGPDNPAGIPASAGAVVLNVTATGGSANTFVAVAPTGAPPAPASNLNLAVGETRANAVTVAVGVDGQVTFANAVGAVDLVVDAVGYYDTTPANGYAPLAPARFLDSRTGAGGWGGPLVAGTPKALEVRGIGWVPADAEAVVMNVTATNGTQNSFLTVSPSGAAPPLASNINFGVGETVPNLVTVKVGTDNRVSFANHSGAVDVVADVVGYYSPGATGLFHPLAPQRLLDSRTDTDWAGPLVAGAPRARLVGGTAGVAASAVAAVANVTVTAGTANSFLTVYPGGADVPNASNLNFATGQTVPNLVAVKLAPDGTIAVANNHGQVDVIIDLAGYFAPA